MAGWLIEESVVRQMQEARKLGAKPTAEQAAAFQERQQVELRDGELPRNMRLAGSTAEIRVQGVLTKTPDIFAYFFGGGNTTYRSIITGLAIAKSDPTVKSVVLYVDSPGGTVDGLFEVLAAIEDFRGTKALSVKAENAMSAAYGISAVAGKIEATNAGASFGSVGVATAYWVFDDYIQITNTDSPDKRPNVKTEEGKEVVRRELDAIHELFIDAIARGRGNSTTAKDVREDYGRGATLLAGEAKKRGMIDSIAKPGLRAVGATQQPVGAQAEEQGETQMDLRTLKASHPELYEQVRTDARAEGVTAERDRVIAHLTLGEPIGKDGLDIAHAAIREGEGMTMTFMARYQASAMNKSDRNARQADSDAAGQAVDGARVTPSAEAAAQEDMGDKVVSILKKRGGSGA